MAEDRKYWAFVSYSHKDRKWGDWVHRKLETFKVPKALAGKESRRGETTPARLFPIFRDREELPTSTDLGSQINTALENSRYLIVICSPRSAGSVWVNEEILTYKRLGKSDRILAMIVDGEPNTSDVPGREDEECFPEALRFELGEEGELCDRRTEPIAADVRPQGDGKDNGFLKLAAGLLGVGFDDLKQRDHERRIRRLRMLVAFSSLLVGVFAALGVALFFQGEETKKQRNEVEKQRNEARSQKNRAEEKEELVSHTLSQSDYMLALERLGNKEPGLALAHLARAIRTSNHRDAGMRASLLLLQRAWTRPISPVLRLPAQDEVAQAVFSPDGVRVAFATKTSKVEIRNPLNWERLIEPIDLGQSNLSWFRAEGEEERKEVRDNQIFTLRFTPDGKYIVAAYGVHAMEGDDFENQVDYLRVWNAATGELASEKVTGKFYGFEIHPQGHMLVTNGTGGPQLRSIPELNLLHKLEGDPFEFDFSVDGKHLVSAGAGGVDLWDVTLGESRGKIGGGQTHVRFFPDGKRLAIEMEGNVRIVDITTGTAEFSFDTGLKQVSGILPLAVDGVNGVLLWEGKTIHYVAPPQIKTELFTFPYPISEAGLTPDHRRLLVSTADGSFQMIPSSGLVKRPLLQAVTLSLGRISDANLAGMSNIVSAILSPDGTRVLGISTDGAALLYSLRLSRAGSFSSGHPPLPMNPENVYDFIEVLPDRKRVLASISEPSPDPNEGMKHSGGQILDIETLEPVSGFLNKDSLLVGADFSADGRIVVISDETAGVAVWDVESETLIARLEDTSKDSSVVALSPDATKIALSQFRYREGGGWNSIVEVWDYRAKKRLHTIPIGEGVGDLCFSPDGKSIAVAVGNEMDGVGFIESWDLASGERLTGRLGAGRLEAYSGVNFSPDGQYVIASYFDYSEIWSLSVERLISDRFHTPGIGMRGAFFSPEYSEDATTIGRLDRAYDVAPAGPPPTWLADLLEVLGGVRLADSGLAVALDDPLRTLNAVTEELDTLPAGDAWANLARWFLEDETKRRLSPSSPVKVVDFIDLTMAKIRAFPPDKSFFADRLRKEIRLVAPDWNEGE